MLLFGVGHGRRNGSGHRALVKTAMPCKGSAWRQNAKRAKPRQTSDRTEGLTLGNKPNLQEARQIKARLQGKNGHMNGLGQ